MKKIKHRIVYEIEYLRNDECTDEDLKRLSEELCRPTYIGDTMYELGIEVGAVEQYNPVCTAVELLEEEEVPDDSKL